MEVNVFEFINKLKKLGPLDGLRQMACFTAPVSKINFGYDYISYLRGTINVNQHLENLVDNNKITMEMLLNITNINLTEKVILTDEQTETYKLFRKNCIDHLESEIKRLNVILEEIKKI